MNALKTLVMGIACACNGWACAADTWVASEHPASVERRISGLLRPLSTLDMASELPGRLVRVDGAIAQPLTAGAVLAIDDTPWRLAVLSASAAVANAQAELLRAEAQWSEAQAEARYRERERQRTRGLTADGTLSVEAQEARDRAAESATQAALIAQAHLAVAAAMVQRSSAELARADHDLQRCRIALPSGWQVVARLREPGAVVMAGEPILRLADVRQLVIDGRLDDAEVEALAQRRAVSVTTADGIPLSISEVRVLAVADATSRKLSVEIVVPATAATVIAGREARVALRVRDVNGWRVPSRFLRVSPHGTSVRSAEGQTRMVTVLRSDGDDRVIAVDADLAGVVLTAP